MFRILVINGPNINMLGVREPEIYGKETYHDLCRRIEEHAKRRGIEVIISQSNHEGDLIDTVQSAWNNADGIVRNPGAYTHTSIALLDALKAVKVPAVEVHLSNVGEREQFRQVSYIRSVCVTTISGHGIEGYLEAIDYLTATHGVCNICM
jgi:3-dehydroquinate dehydratase-2